MTHNKKKNNFTYSVQGEEIFGEFTSSFETDIHLYEEDIEVSIAYSKMLKKIGILNNTPIKFAATRYHSLIIDRKTLSKELEITAETSNGIIMGVKHKKYNVHGVQFHPESIKTPEGMKLLRNFINYKS